MSIKIHNQVSKPGEKKVIQLPVAHLMEGADLSIAVHAVVGKKPGPVLTLMSLLHGDEWQTMEIVRRVVEGLSVDKLSGTLLAVPVANPIALANRIRTTRGSPDAPDLNQVFPGGSGWFTQLMARPLTDEVLKNSDYLVDLHGRWWGSNVEQLNYYNDHPDESVNAKCYEMARGSGMRMLHNAKITPSMPSPRNCFGYAVGALNIPSIMVEIGGLGYAQDLEEGWIEHGVQIVRNVLITLGMLEGDLELPERVLEYSSAAMVRVAASHGGYFEPAVDPNPLIREVVAGEIVGRVISPHTFEVLETLASPVNGTVFLLSRGNMIHPGEWGFAVVDIDHPEAEWIQL